MFSHLRKHTRHAKWGYLWVTLAFFVLSFAGHWILGWFAFVKTQTANGQAVDISQYLIEAGRDTLENWQSEFLQLIWQVAGLAILWCVGSPQSKEGDERKEAKLDYLINKIDPKDGPRTIRALEEEFPKK